MEIKMRNNPDDLSNQLVHKIKVWLRGEIQDVRNNFEDDLDSRELGILDGRYECAESLIEQIKKWENEND
jgi:hypothetical protein